MASLSLAKTSQQIDQAVETGLAIAVVVPCYQVERTIAKVVAEIPGFVRDVILVDDASPGATPQVLEDLRGGRVDVVHLKKNRGVGGATIAGCERAVELGADIIVKLDGDGQMDPSLMPALIAPIVTGRADYTKGNRFLHSKQIRSMPLVRRIGNIGLSFLVKLASGYWNIFDPSNGYTALNAAVFKILDQTRLHPRYFFETSMLIELGLQRAVVRDVSMPAVYGDETSHLSEVNSLFDFPPRLIKASLRRILYQYFVRDFSAVSLFLMSGLFSTVFGVVWGLYQWAQSSQQHVDASTGTVMIAVLPVILGVQLLLQTIVIDIQNTPTEVIDDLTNRTLGMTW